MRYPTYEKLIGECPRPGDWLLLPKHADPLRWFKVENVRDPQGPTPGWKYVDGYEVREDGSHPLPATHFILVDLTEVYR